MCVCVCVCVTLEDKRFVLIYWDLYHLYKLYEEIGNTEKANLYKNEIITDYPASRYAKIILNPLLEIAVKIQCFTIGIDGNTNV